MQFGLVCIYGKNKTHLLTYRLKIRIMVNVLVAENGYKVKDLKAEEMKIS